MNTPISRSCQSGMAVISALLIVTVVAVIAAQIIASQTQFTRTVQADQNRVQGTWLLRGALEQAEQLLWHSRLQDPLTRLDQQWAHGILVAGASESHPAIELRIEDEQGKFNLRNLVRDGQVDMTEYASFERLCLSLGLNLSIAQRISQRVIESYPRRTEPVAEEPTTANTFDSGRLTSPNTKREPEPAKRPMLRVIDDLYNIKGVDRHIIELLRTHVTILPVNTWINGNTARPEAIAAHIPDLSLRQAQSLLAERDQGRWFINRGDFVNRLQRPDLDVSSVKVGITSNWFLVHGQTRIGERLVTMQALLLRNEQQKPEVIWTRVGV